MIIQTCPSRKYWDGFFVFRPATILRFIRNDRISGNRAKALKERRLRHGKQ